MGIRRHHEKSPKEESPNEKSPKLKNRDKSGPDSPPQALGMENKATDNVVRLD